MSEETPQTPTPEAPREEEPWAVRLGLVRPRHGRYLAGVCAAIGRATNTDPLLWRVLIGVLAIFGVGIVIYLAGWLIMPAEGDTASPIESLFGRGHSSTSAVLTLVLGVLTVILLGALTDSWVVGTIAAIALVVAALALNPGVVPQRPIPARPEEPVTAVPANTSPYQPPFAPHGPYASATETVPPAPVVAKPKPEPSRLGRLIFGVVLICLGALGLADMAGVSVPGAAYVAAALAVIGVGLIVGAWFGRARAFILLGLVLSLILPMAAAGKATGPRGSGGREVWSPNNFEEVSSTYAHRFGEAVLDLSQVDFNGKSAEITADISFGDLRVLLPSDVDATVITHVSFGGAEIFDKSSDGVGAEQSVKDQGDDGEGGGSIVINLNVRFGHAEVTR